MSAATFPASYTLTVSKSGTGSGTVTGSPGAISCGSTCSANFDNGTSVTLTEVPASGSTFGGWAGACAGASATCTVSITAAASVTAAFNSGPIVTTIEENSSSIKYTGTWTTAICVSSACSPNHQEKFSTISGNRAVVSFTGTQIAWIATKGPKGGKASVYVDGVLKATINLYSATVQDGVVVYTSPVLTSTSHTMRVQLTTNKRADIDAFRVTS